MNIRTPRNGPAPTDQVGQVSHGLPPGHGGQQGALCYINPLFLREPPSRGALHKRHRFKRSLRVRVSAETSMTLSSPPRSADLDCAEPSLPLQKRASTASGLLRRTAALLPTSEEEEDLIPKDPQQVWVPSYCHTLLLYQTLIVLHSQFLLVHISVVHTLNVRRMYKHTHANTFTFARANKL